MRALFAFLTFELFARRRAAARTGSLRRTVSTAATLMSRDPQATKGPIPIPGGIHLEWIVTYTRDGLPPFVLKGEEWDLFRDDRLVMHYELIHNGTEVLEYLRKHDAALLPSG